LMLNLKTSFHNPSRAIQTKIHEMLFSAKGQKEFTLFPPASSF